MAFKIFRGLIASGLLVPAGLTLTSYFGRSHLLGLTSHFRVLYFIAAIFGVTVAIVLRTKVLVAAALVLVSRTASH